MTKRRPDDLRSQQHFDEYRTRRSQDPSYDLHTHLRLIGDAIER